MTETLQGCLREGYPHYAPHNTRHIAERLGVKFQTTFISIVLPFERPGRLQGAYLMNLGAPPLPPVAPTTPATSQNTSGPNSKQPLFRYSYRLNALEGYRENNPIFWGTPSPICPPLGDKGGGLGGNDRGGG